MNFMTEVYSIKKFVDDYLALETEDLKEEFLQSNLDIVSYVPVVEKLALADTLVNSTCVNKNNGYIQVNSVMYNIFMYKILIEKYTNLRSESTSFYVEYDALKSSGILSRLLFVVKTEDGEIPPMIPFDEISEFRTICDMTRDDLRTNKYESHAFIIRLMEDVSKLSTSFEPMLKELQNEILKAENKSE